MKQYLVDLKPHFYEIAYATYLQYIFKGILFWHKELGHNNLSKYVILKKESSPAHSSP